MVKLQGDIPPKAVNYIKYEIQRQRGREMEDKTWRLIGIKNKKSKDKDPIFELEFCKKTRANKDVPRIRVVQNVSVTIARKFLGW